MHLPKSADRIFSYGNVAWGRNGVSSVGTLLWTVSDPGADRSGEKAGKAAQGGWLGIHYGGGVLWLDPVPGRGSFLVFCLCKKPVCIPWRNHPAVGLS